MSKNETIAINRETGTRFGQEPYNLAEEETVPPLAYGEFGDTASTVEAGQNKTSPRTVAIDRLKWTTE